MSARLQRLLHAGHDAFAARTHEAAGTRELEQQHLVDLRRPAGLRPLAEVAAREQPGLIVVGAEVRRTRMRDVDGDERHARLEVLRRDGRSDRLVGLKLDDEIDLLLDEQLGVAQRDLGLIAVVDDDHLEPFALGRHQQPRMHLAGKRAVLPLRRIPDPEAPVRSNLDHQAIVPFVDLVDEAALMEGVQQPEAHPLAVSRALDDVAQTQDITRRVERLEDFRGVDQRLYDVRVVRSGRHRGGELLSRQ